MIAEALTWMFSKAAKGARRAGLVYEAAGISGRFRRNKSAWQPHLEKTKCHIRAQIQKTDPNMRILVLGAGLALDLPLAELNKHPAGAILCDAVVTPTLQLKLFGYPNLSYEIKDITGLLSHIRKNSDCDTISVPNSTFLRHRDFGLIISCNILSQLPLSFRNYASDKKTAADTTQNKAHINPQKTHIMNAVQDAHIRTLKSAGCPVLLISDFKQRTTTGGKTETALTAPIEQLPSPPLETWTWDIAPEGEIGKSISVTLDVGVWLLTGPSLTV